MLFPTKSLFLFIKFSIRRYFIKIIFVAGTTTVLGCSGAVWKNHGDSCIHISEKPPLRRVINYSDHELCGRKLSPRTAPNPLTRPKPNKIKVTNPQQILKITLRPIWFLIKSI